MSRLLLVLGVIVILILGVAGGAWWYLFGPNQVEAADLVPASTVLLATIPNAAEIVTGYETSHLKTLVDSPNTQPLRDAIVNALGDKNIALLQTFAPNLSGQSFFAVTHFDWDHPERVGLIGAMKPKAGLGDFDAFVEKLKTTWPDILKQGKTGTGSVAGVDYQWIQGPGASDKVCVAQVGGWIVTTWGEASLQDWIERFQGKSTTPSLAKDPDYRKSVERVGRNAMTLVYINYHAVVDLLRKQMAKANPAMGDYFSKKLAAIGGAALGTRFENGAIVDRFSMLMPRQAQIDSGASVEPCPFDTLKFTGPNTYLYWASSVDWKHYYKNLQEQSGAMASGPAGLNPMDYLLRFLKTWAQGADVDIQHNIIDALGSEFSVQAEWNPDSLYPQAGLFMKVDKPDDFKSAITAIINSLKQTYAATAEIKETNSNGQNFAVMKFNGPALLSPTITEGGPYLGIFTNENQAEHSFGRDPAAGLEHNADFSRQVGDRRSGATQLLFLDSPRLLDHAYRTALPYLSIAGMFNKNLAGLLKGRQLPPDLTWLAPMGTWNFTATPDDDGIRAYSVSGIGNQGIVLCAAVGGTVETLQTMGLLPRPTGAPGMPHGSAPLLSLNSTSGRGNPAPFPALTQSAMPSVPTGPMSVIYITPEGKLFFDETPVDPAQFGDLLKAKKAANQNLKLIVNADKDAPADTLSLVMDAGANAGFGVLPSIRTTGKDSFPPAINSSAVAPPPLPEPDAATNAPAAAAPEIPASTNAAPVPVTPDASTNSAPTPTPAPAANGTNSDSNATPPTPAPTATP